MTVDVLVQVYYDDILSAHPCMGECIIEGSKDMRIYLGLGRLLRSAINKCKLQSLFGGFRYSQGSETMRPHDGCLCLPDLPYYVVCNLE